MTDAIVAMLSNYHGLIVCAAVSGAEVAEVARAAFTSQAVRKVIQSREGRDENALCSG